MARKARRERTGDDALAFTSGLLLGGLVAGAAAIVLAPADGQTIRSRVAATVRDLLGLEPDDVPSGPVGAAPDGQSADGSVTAGRSELAGSRR